MLIITSGRLSNSRRVRRQVTYQPESRDCADNSSRPMSDILQDHRKRDQKRQRNLERDFQNRLRSTASVWSFEYCLGSS